MGVDLAAFPALQAYSAFIGALRFVVVKANAAIATNPSSRFPSSLLYNRHDLYFLLSVINNL